MNPGILLITPVRDEAFHLEEVIRCVTSQSVRPGRWVLVDDNSRDRSPEICAGAARAFPWIRTLSFEGPPRKRQLGTHVYEVLKAGYEYGVALCREEGIDYRYIGFLDADMFPVEDYFERLIEVLEKNPAMGIVSGGVYVEDEAGEVVWEKSPVQWPWGGARVLRRKCLEEIGGVMTVNSGDAVTSIRAMKLGYRIRQYKEIKVVQARATSSATGLTSGYFQKGIDDHYLGYSLPYAVVKGFHRSWGIAARLGVAYLTGYVSSLLRRRRRIDDPVVREFCRWRLLRRIMSRDLPVRQGEWPKRMRAQGGMNVLKCCLVVYADYYTDTRMSREAETLAARGYSVDAICTRGEKGGMPSVSRGVRVIPLRIDRYRGSSKIRFIASYAHFFIRAFLSLSWRHVRGKYDIVQVHNIPDCLVFTALIPKWTGAKIILDVRDPMPEGYMVKFALSFHHLITRIILFQERASFRFADEILCVSEQHRRLFVKHGAPESKITVLMNLPDDNIFGNVARVREKKGGFELVFHGTLAARLGIDIAIRAIDIVRHEVRDVTFRIYGGGEFLPVLKELIEELDMGKHVHLTGRFHPAGDIPALIRTADAGIVPNRKNVITELMMPVKLIEYIALGIPVIAPRLDTIEYYFEDKINFFDPGDPHDLASTILEIYYNPDKAEMLAKRALGFLEKHNWKGETEKYYRMIDRMMAEEQ